LKFYDKNKICKLYINNNLQPNDTIDTKDDTIDTKDDTIDTKDDTIDYTSEISMLHKQLNDEKKHKLIIEEKLKRLMADFNSLERQIKLNANRDVALQIDKFMIDFLQIYDDLILAKNVLHDEHVNIGGLNSIIKNINSLLSKYEIKTINALGEIFDPHSHEAIKVIEDDALDENTIVKEIRKGYISHNRVIKPSIVIISKKSECE